LSEPQYKIVGIVLAAGKSRRMGRDKLQLRSRGGQSILDTIIDVAASSTLDEVTVLLDEQRKNTAHHEQFKVSYGAIRSDNMAQSVNAAIDYATAASASHAMIILGDMPAVVASDINALIEQSLKTPKAIVRPTYKSEAGNPVILPLRYAGEFKAKLSGDAGARTIFETGQFDIIDVECGAGVLIDIDTPELYQAYLRD
jgi:molybdenum cofactor cytidylyltransferase